MPQEVNSGASSHRSNTTSTRSTIQQDISIPLVNPNEINTVLYYDIATMSYQTQQYGRALLYLTEILKNLE